jgi:hypothetical protein
MTILQSFQQLLQACELRGNLPPSTLRDVFNDVSKYIRNISNSLNSLFPELLDAPDRGISPRVLTKGEWSLGGPTGLDHPTFVTILKINLHS